MKEFIIRRVRRNRYHVRVIAGCYMSFRSYEDAAKWIEEVMRCPE